LALQTAFEREKSCIIVARTLKTNPGSVQFDCRCVEPNCPERGLEL
jgi:hypothetical protein